MFGEEWLFLGVAGDFAFWEQLLQTSHTHHRYFGIIQVKGPKLLELGELLETRIRYVGRTQVKRSELLSLDQFLEAHIRYLSAEQPKVPELLELG